MSNTGNGSLKDIVEAACNRVAIKVVEIAKQTGTPVVIWQDGQVKHVPPEEFDTSAWQVEPPTSPQ